MFGIFAVILGVFLVGYLILKKYYAPWSLLIVGLLLLALVSFVDPNPLLTNKTATKSPIFDIFQIFTNVSSSTLAGLGLQIMVISGFADYLDKIGATKALVQICSKPLSHISSPYLLLGIAYIVGQIINIFIPSAVGLGVLMMLTIFPLLMAVGVSRVSAAAVIVTMSCLDLGPASSNSIVTAKLSEIGVMDYFINGQLPVSCVTVLSIAVAHIFIQRWFDKRDVETGRLTSEDFTLKSELSVKDAQPSAPKFYAIFPIIPIVLLFVFSKFVITGYRLELVTAIVICTIFTFSVDWLTKRKFKECVTNTKVFFAGMGRVFTSTVALIICAGVFAEGLKRTGGIDTLISWGASMQGTGGIIMLLVMVIIMVVASIVTGSANAAFFAFSSLIPNAARAVNWEIVVMACPVQLVSGLARSMSPIAGVTIAVSSIAELSPFDVVRRTIPVMAIGSIATVVASLVLL